MHLGNVDLMEKLSLKVRVRIITVGSAQSGVTLATLVTLEGPEIYKRHWQNDWEVIHLDEIPYVNLNVEYALYECKDMTYFKGPALEWRSSL